MGEIWLVRHGETEWSASGQHTGRTDIELTDEGCRQAELLGTTLQGHTFSRVISSPLKRAVATCRLAGLGDDPELSDDLLEWDYGDVEGKTTHDIRAQLGDPAWTIWQNGTPGGETPEEIAVRCKRVLDDVAGEGGSVALVAHGHLLRILAVTWMGLPAKAGALLQLTTASVSVLGHEHETRTLRLWNQSWEMEPRGAE